ALPCGLGFVFASRIASRSVLGPVAPVLPTVIGVGAAFADEATPRTITTIIPRALNPRAQRTSAPYHHGLRRRDLEICRERRLTSLAIRRNRNRETRCRRPRSSTPMFSRPASGPARYSRCSG